MPPSREVRFRVPSWRWIDRSHMRDHDQAPAGLVRAYANDLYAVQWFEHETSWGKVIHLMVCRGDGEPIRSWPHLQRIKDEIVGKERVAVEVYPRAADVHDAANVYHLWVLPEGMELPFGLHLAEQANE